MSSKYAKCLCYICQEEMRVDDRPDHLDYSCCPRWDDHHLSIRVKDGKMTKLRLRFNDDNGKRLHLKIHYDEGFTEVWADPDSEHVKIDRLIDLDFSDLPKLRHKLRTYITFS